MKEIIKEFIICYNIIIHNDRISINIYLRFISLLFFWNFFIVFQFRII